MKEFHVTVYDRVKRVYLVEAEDEYDVDEVFDSGGYKLIDEIDDMDGDIVAIVEVV